MDKVKNISLGGFSFTIEETAYNALNTYLVEVHKHLSTNADKDEILYDIEQRMAELLKDQMKGREVVISQDIQYLISVLGRPEQYVDDEENTASTPQFSNSFKGRKLYRDIDDKKLGGVLSGISHYFKWDVTLLRIVFALLIFANISFFAFSVNGKGISFTSTLIVLYFIFWGVVPAAVTTSEKLEMKGEEVNLDTLSNFKTSFPSQRREWTKSLTDKKIAGVLGGLALYLSINSTWLRIAYVAVVLFSLPIFHQIGVLAIIGYFILAAVLKNPTLATEEVHSLKTSDTTITSPQRSNFFFMLLKGVFYFIAIVICIPLFIALIGTIISIFGATIAGGVTLLTLNDYLPYLLAHQWQVVVLYLASGLLLLVPISLIVLLALKLFTKGFRTPKAWVVANVLCLVVGIMLLLTVLGSVGKEFVTAGKVETKIPITSTADTLVISEKASTPYDGFVSLHERGVDLRNNVYFIDIQPTNDSLPYLLITKKSKGRTVSEATENASRLEFPIEFNKNVIELPNHYTLKKGNVFRNQEVKVSLCVPAGKYVKTIANRQLYMFRKWHPILEKNTLYKVTKDSIIQVTSNN
jgi:phage shock protein C, pspC